MGDLCASDFSGRRWSATYHLTGSAADAKARAELLCIEQTVESADQIIPPGAIREHLLGQVAEFRCVREERYEAVLTYPVELLDESVGSLLHVAYGSASLQRGVRLADIRIPETDLSRWDGPRFGTAGLRKLLGVSDRSLVCGVLKPLGLSASQLADLARDFALGGIDIVKDDQGLADHRFCSFTERVSRCAEAVAEVSARTGQRCLYAPHLTGSFARILEQADYAHRAGAGAALVCPGIVGFDQIAELVRQKALGLPILSHPALMGSYYVARDAGIAPHIIFGLMPRLAGADVTIYPTFGMNYPISREDGRAIATACRCPLGHLAAIFPTAAGRMGPTRISEMADVYGNDLVYVLGSELHGNQGNVREACRAFLRQLRIE
jgi:ribulose-bisphosphate carboxylase large chain